MKFPIKILTTLSAVLLLLGTHRTQAASTAPDLVCVGTTKTYNVNPTPGSRYKWQINGGTPLTNTTSSMPITWTTPGTYVVSVQETMVNNCVGPLVTLAVTVESPPTLAITAGDICAGKDLVFTATNIPNAIYSWQDGGMPVAGQSGYIYTMINPPAGPRTVSVTATTLANCVSNTPVATATVKPLPMVNLTARTGLVCLGGNLVYEASGNYSTYEWLMNSQLLPETGSVLTYPTHVPGNMTVSVKGFQNGCESLPQTMTGTIQDTPPMPQTNGIAVCAEEGTTLDVSSLVSSAGLTHLWYSHASTPSRISPPLLSTSAPASKTYYVSAMSSAGCESDRAPVYVDVLDNPVIINKAKKDDKTIEIVVDKGTPPYIYRIQNSPSLPFHGTAVISELISGKNVFEVEDSKGCKTKDSLTIQFNDLIPETYFTPNGDGDNDTWDIVNIDKYPRTEIYVHDRYGKELYKGTGATFKGWDGMYRGQPVVGTDYWYVINVYELGQRMVGHFNLKR